MIKPSLIINYMSIPKFKKITSIFVPYTRLIHANLTLIFILGIPAVSYCQENVFSASIITDINFSQIRGDMLAGYHRLGFGAGVGVSYRLFPRWSGRLELMYRNAGSRESPYLPTHQSINIHMAQIPVYASYMTWWDNGLSRINFDLGVLYSRIVKTRIQFHRYEAYQSAINQNDIDIMAGMGF